jgi:hypothetical protein
MLNFETSVRKRRKRRKRRRFLEKGGQGGAFF